MFLIHHYSGVPRYLFYFNVHSTNISRGLDGSSRLNDPQRIQGNRKSGSSTLEDIYSHAMTVFHPFAILDNQYIDTRLSYVYHRA